MSRDKFREYRQERAVVEAEWLEALERIQAGIALLDADADAARAFQFANRAMWLQRIRTIYSSQARQGDTPDLAEIDVPVNRSWRPFQLAFILLNLPAMTDPTHPERSSADPNKLGYADLLWFPTGGGKTEAYLGLTAYTLAIRRTQGVIGGLDGNAGVAVLMRYTLRLLTLQQFQRATALIAACEIIRREDPRALGEASLSASACGSAIAAHPTGQSIPPRRLSKAVAKGRHYGSSIGGSGTPVQLTHCPWCGSEINPGRNIIVETAEAGRGRTFPVLQQQRWRVRIQPPLFPRRGLADCRCRRRNLPPAARPINRHGRQIRAYALARPNADALRARFTHYCKRHGYNLA